MANVPRARGDSALYLLNSNMEFDNDYETRASMKMATASNTHPHTTNHIYTLKRTCTRHQNGALWIPMHPKARKNIDALLKIFEFRATIEWVKKREQNHWNNVEINIAGEAADDFSTPNSWTNLKSPFPPFFSGDLRKNLLFFSFKMSIIIVVFRFSNSHC